MEYKETKEFVRCRRGADIYSECGTDYSLPDYNGDVRRILFTDARVHPSGSFENGESVDFSGIVTFYMVYSDSENRINSINFSSDYDFTVKCNSETYEGSSADISVASFNLRLLGPRKISARATVAAGVTISERTDISPSGSAFEKGSSPEVECVSIDAFMKRCSAVSEREYAEELVRLDGVVSDEVEIIYSDADCLLDSCATEDGGVSVRGNLRAYALIRVGDDMPYIAEKSIRIDESLPFDSITAEHRLIPHVTVGSVRPAVSADEGGCSVVSNIIIELSCESYGNIKADAVVDAYRRDAEVKNSFENFGYSELVTVLTEREELSETVPRESLEVENLKELICLGAVAKVEHVDIEEGSAAIKGEIKYSGIALACDAENRISYHPFKLTAEFEKNVNINCQNDENTRVQPYVYCHQCSATFDDNNIYLAASAYVRLSVTEELSVRLLSSSELVEDTVFENTGATITVYYPEQGEGLFEIAKKFHTTVEKIMEDNSAALRAMSGESGTKNGVKRLLIF